MDISASKARFACSVSGRFTAKLMLYSATDWEMKWMFIPSFARTGNPLGGTAFRSGPDGKKEFPFRIKAGDLHGDGRFPGRQHGRRIHGLAGREALGRFLVGQGRRFRVREAGHVMADGPGLQDGGQDAGREFRPACPQIDRLTRDFPAEGTGDHRQGSTPLQFGNPLLGQRPVDQRNPVITFTQNHFPAVQNRLCPQGGAQALAAELDEQRMEIIRQAVVPKTERHTLAEDRIDVLRRRIRLPLESRIRRQGLETADQGKQFGMGVRPVHELPLQHRIIGAGQRFAGSDDDTVTGTEIPPQEREFPGGTLIQEDMRNQ